ncbi:MAG: TRAP transporter large permease [Sneathiellaceae bacterium]
MEWYWAGLMMLGVLLVLMAIGTPVFMAFLITNALGVFVFFGLREAAIEQLVSNAAASVTSFILVPVPLFVLMGELFFRTGLAVRVFDAFDVLIGRVPARLSYIAVGSGTAFATLTGTSVGSAAMMGSMLVPEMSRRGYKPHMSIGPIMGAGGLAILIPPSALAVLLGSIARIDIGALLLAGVVPGLVLALLYAVLIFVQARLDPTAAPAYGVAESTALRKLKVLVTEIAPMLLVILLVIGLIILGVATPTESAAFGVLGVLLLAVLKGRLGWTPVREALRGTIKISAMLLVIVIGSSTFSQIIAFSGASRGLLAWATETQWAPLWMLLLMFAVLLFLGMFLDQISQMMLTLPVFVPIAAAAGFDPVWFGIVVLLAMEISLVTPPFGLLLFVMMGAAPPGIGLPTIVSAALPYIGCALVLLVLLILVPDLALWLPSMVE